MNRRMQQCIYVPSKLQQSYYICLQVPIFHPSIWTLPITLLSSLLPLPLLPFTGPRNKIKVHSKISFLLLYPFLLKAETFFSLLKINSADFCSSEIIILFWIWTRKWFCNSYKVSFHLYLQEEECLFSCLGFLRSHRIVWLNYFRFTMSIFLILV